MFLRLDRSAFIKENAFNLDGWFLVAPQARIAKGLGFHEMLVIQALDGTNTLPEIVNLVAKKLAIPHHEAQTKCFHLLKPLIIWGLVRVSRVRIYMPVRRIPRRTTYSLESLILAITNRCNMSCVYCYAETDNTVISLDLLDRVYEGIDSLGVTHVSLTGGEPTLHPHFWNIVEQLSQNAVAVTVNTNGSQLYRPDAERLAELGVFSVCVSVDSLTASELRRLGQPASSGMHVLNVIKDLKDVGLRVVTKTTFLPGVNCSIPQAAALWKRLDLLDLDLQTFSEVVPVGRARDYDVSTEALEVAAFLGKRTQTDYSSPVREYNTTTPRRLAWPEPSFPRSACGVGIELTSILADGTVLPCVQLPEIVAGNLADNSLNVIWEHSEAYAAFRNKDLCEAPICRKCPVWDVCKGGCKAKASVYGGSLAYPDLWSCATFGYEERAKSALLARRATELRSRKH